MCFDGVYCSSDKQIENSLAQQLKNKQTTWIQGKLELLLVLLIGLVGNPSCWVKPQWLDCSKRQKNIFNRFHRAHYLLCFHGNVIAGHSGHSPAPTVYTSITKQGLRDHTHTRTHTRLAGSYRAAQTSAMNRRRWFQNIPLTFARLSGHIKHKDLSVPSPLLQKHTPIPQLLF